MWSRMMPSSRELFTAVLAVLLTLTVTSLIRPAAAGPGGPSTDFAFVATGANFPDALGAAAAAGVLLAPVLLVQQNSVPAETEAELNRLHPTEIFVVGGSAVISDGVVAALEALWFDPTVTRIAGGNRYATAAALSASVFPTRGYYPVASFANGDSVEEVTTTDEVVQTVSLTAPTDGNVLVTSSSGVFEETAGDALSCSITTGTTWEAATGGYFLSGGANNDVGTVSGTRGFYVVAGEEFTANLVCKHEGTSGASYAANSTLTAIFVADI